jgi:hypothetical protein
VPGFYVIAETPSAYLVENPVWLANLLIVSGLKLLGRSVLVGYCNHQMLGLAATKADVIASGTWLNVRAFPPEKFYMQVRRMFHGARSGVTVRKHCQSTSSLSSIWH